MAEASGRDIDVQLGVGVAGAVTVKGVRRAEPALEQGQGVVEPGQLRWYRSMTQVW